MELLSVVVDGVVSPERNVDYKLVNTIQDAKIYKECVAFVA